MRRVTPLFALACLLMIAPGAAALTPRASVSLLTIFPGDAVHAQFGHTALRVRDPRLGLDRVYNYGTFDFGDPLFIPKFIRGRLDYQLSVAPFEPVIEHYRRAHRAVVEQVLNLTPAEAQNLFRRLEVNALPANRGYRYRFLRDNCSTRPRDMIEAAIGPALTWGDPSDEPRTFREWLMPYLAGEPWLGLGINGVLGQPADRVASARQAMFLPLPLMEATGGATIGRADGDEPLVSQTRRLYWPAGAGEAESSLPWPAMLMWGLLAVAGGMTLRTRLSEPGRPRPGRGGAAITSPDTPPRAAAPRSGWGQLGSEGQPGSEWFDALLFFVAGVAGTVVLLMWTATLHEVTGPNWNLLWAWPTHLVAAALLLKRSPSQRLRVILRRYFQAAAVVAAVTLVAWPVLPQALPWALWPFAALLGLRGWVRGRAKPQAA